MIFKSHVPPSNEIGFWPESSQGWSPSDRDAHSNSDWLFRERAVTHNAYFNKSSIRDGVGT